MKYTYSPQKGKPGHCLVAQVWDEKGNSIAIIESTKLEKDANKIVKLFAESPEIKEQHGKMAVLLKKIFDSTILSGPEVAKIITTTDTIIELSELITELES